MTATEIRFYRSNEKPYGAFSNLFKRAIRFQGREFPTSEHAYQFGKARKPEVREWLMAAPSPSLLAMAGHGLATWDIVPGWSQMKVNRMRLVLTCKFAQHDDLRDLLLSTGVARIVEVGTADDEVSRFWGDADGRGRNMLGVLLMAVRADFHAGILVPHVLEAIAEGEKPWTLATDVADA